MKLTVKFQLSLITISCFSLLLDFYFGEVTIVGNKITH